MLGLTFIIANRSTHKRQKKNREGFKEFNQEIIKAK